MAALKFSIEGKISGKLGRAGKIETAHGVIETPAFVPVATKATVKALTPEQVQELGTQIVLANTYHLYLQPGDKLIQQAGGLHQFMNWPGPLMTDSGGFQVFSLGAAFGSGISKFIGSVPEANFQVLGSPSPLEGAARPDRGNLFGGSALTKAAKITEEGVTFYSHLDGSEHLLTPERSMEIQHNLGADIIFAFDECTSPQADHTYQKEAMERTHRWAERSLAEHERLAEKMKSQEEFLWSGRRRRRSEDLKILPGAELGPSLFGIVQGGRFEDLRHESAEFISNLDFAGFGIGGSFVKEDMNTAVKWVNEILPEDKPRHLLGVGEPEDLFGGIENGVDLFDCVAPTRMARNGALYTHQGKINILNSAYQSDFTSIENDCGCYTCSPRPHRHGETSGGASYTRAYLAHLFRAKEILAATLATIHNLHFIVNLVKQIRQSIIDGNFGQFKTQFLKSYSK